MEISFKVRGAVREGPLTVGYTGYGGGSHIGHGHHWYGNAESYFLIGHALRAGMSFALH